MDRKALYAKIKAANYDRDLLKSLGISEGAQDLISKILEADPVKRYSPGEALKHPWITGEGQPQMVRKQRLGSAIISFAEATALLETHEGQSSVGQQTANNSQTSAVEHRKKSAIQLRDFLFFRK